MLLNVVEVLCKENPSKGEPCGQLAIEFHLTLQDDILKNKTMVQQSHFSELGSLVVD